jgi:hypothetical protein
LNSTIAARDPCLAAAATAWRWPKSKTSHCSARICEVPSSVVFTETVLPSGSCTGVSRVWRPPIALAVMTGR